MGVAVTWLYLRATLFGQPSNDFVKGCVIVRRDSIIFFDFLILLIFEPAVVIFTLSSWFKDFHLGTPLLRVIYWDSVAFFLVLFALTLFAIVVLVAAPPSYGGLVPASIRAIHSIICCRIILNLRQAAFPTATLTPAWTSLMFEIAPGQQVNQVETIQLGVCSTLSDEEDLRRRTWGDHVSG